MATINLVTFVVRNESGSIDLDSTMNKFRGELVKYQAELEADLSSIEESVLEVFAQYPGAAIQLPALRTKVLLHLQMNKNVPVSLENYKALTDKIMNYVRANSSAERADGKLFSLTRGKNNGVRKWSDVPEK